MGVINVSTVVGYKVTKTVFETQLLSTTHVVLKAPHTSLDPTVGSCGRRN